MTLYEVYMRHVVRLDQILNRMTRRGMPIDQERRLEYAIRLQSALTVAESEFESVIPREIRSVEPKGGFVRQPPDTSNLVTIRVRAVTKRCSVCGLQNPTKPHFKTLKRPTEAKPQNQCSSGTVVSDVEEVERYARLSPLKVSSKLLLKYMDFRKHPKVYHGKGVDRKPTTDENALRTILLKHPDDAVYNGTLLIRKLKKLGGTYIGIPDPEQTPGPTIIIKGLRVGSDGRIHPFFTHTPSTLRLASENPNAQNMPRPSDEWYSMVRGMFVAGEGMTFVARDFSGIEAVLVGYEAGSKAYTRLSLIDIHTYVTMYWLHQRGKIPFADLPQLSWSDADLKAGLAAGKVAHKKERNGIKHNVHAGNFGAGAKKTQEMLFDMLGWVVPIKEVRDFKDFYKELFPEIHNWHWRMARQVDEVGYVRNNYGYLHRFYGVLNWENVHGVWSPKLGDTAKNLFAFKPQSTASAIMKESLIDMDDEEADIAEFLRLTIHDEMLLEVPLASVTDTLCATKRIMEKPRLELPLDPSWDMGTHLAILTEAKVGNVWATMKGVTD